jgi:hypothetical protein
MSSRPVGAAYVPDAPAAAILVAESSERTQRDRAHICLWRRFKIASASAWLRSNEPCARISPTTAETVSAIYFAFCAFASASRASLASCSAFARA